MKQEEMSLKLQELYIQVDRKTEWWFKNGGLEKSYEEYLTYLEPEQSKIETLSKELRMQMEPEYSKLPDYGDVMSLQDFIENCEDGSFIDYDGFGNYVKNNQMSNISIYPSDIKAKKVRKDFDTIIWFNR